MFQVDFESYLADVGKSGAALKLDGVGPVDNRPSTDKGLFINDGTHFWGFLYHPPPMVG